MLCMWLLFIVMNGRFIIKIIICIWLILFCILLCVVWFLWIGCVWIRIRIFVKFLILFVSLVLVIRVLLFLFVVYLVNLVCLVLYVIVVRMNGLNCVIMLWLICSRLWYIFMIMWCILSFCCVICIILFFKVWVWGVVVVGGW